MEALSLSILNLALLFIVMIFCVALDGQIEGLRESQQEQAVKQQALIEDACKKQVFEMLDSTRVGQDGGV